MEAIQTLEAIYLVEIIRQQNQVVLYLAVVLILMQIQEVYLETLIINKAIAFFHLVALLVRTFKIIKTVYLAKVIRILDLDQIQIKILDLA